MTVKEAKDFDAKALVEDCKKTLKLIDEYAMKEDLARNQRFEKRRVKNERKTHRQISE